MSIAYNSIVPSGRYLVIKDNNGADKVLEVPSKNSTLVFGDTDFYWADGSEDHPIPFNNIREVSSGASGILALKDGAQISLIPSAATRKFLVAEAGNIIFSDVGITGLPVGYGFLTRPMYDMGAATPVVSDAVFLHTPGLYYIDQSGNAQAVAPGSDVQFLGWNATVPVAKNLPGGSVSAGGSNIGLEGVVGTNSGSVTTVTASAPKLTLVNAGGDEVTVTNVSVTASLIASVGLGGLDEGTEQASRWYYLYVISNGTLANAVISLNDDAPTDTDLGAYEYFCLTSVFRNDASGNIVDYIQSGREISTDFVLAADAAGITASYTQMPGTWTSIIPPNAKAVKGIVGGSQAAAQASALQIWVASNNEGVGEQPMPYTATTMPGNWLGFRFNACSFRLGIIPGAIPQWRANTTNAKMRVGVTGYSI